MKLISKFIPFEIKDINLEGRSFRAVASTEQVDRDGDIIRAAGWDLNNFLKNPVVLWAHRYSDPPVAKAKSITIEGDKLIFEPQFATKEEYEFADTIFKLYAGGFLRTFSVGFIGLRWEDIKAEGATYATGREYKEQELLEVSACPVPSNPGALTQASMKSLIEEAGIKVCSGCHLTPEKGGVTEKEVADLLEAMRTLTGKIK